MGQVLGAFLIFTLVPALGALPLTGWIVRLLTGKNLKKIGTGNVSVSAAFYHGGTPVGLLSVAAEAFKGVFAVLLARHFFGADPIWPVLSLMFLVMGRYWGSQGAGTTNIAWGFFVYDPVVAGLTFLISLIGFTVLRMRDQGRTFVLFLMPTLTALCHPTDGMRILVVACLSGLVAWIYQKIPNDLDLSATASDGRSRRMFRFFQGDRALYSIENWLSASKVGNKAATLSQLHEWGYPVPPGYVLPAGDDPKALIDTVFPQTSLKPTASGAIASNTSHKSSRTQPGRTPRDRVKGNKAKQTTVVARSSAVGEDTLSASAAGQYVSVTEITSPEALERAITVCMNAYNSPSAVRYRQDRGLPEGEMNVLVQPHIFGTFSGVAFSRDPVTQASDVVVVESLPGDASQVVSGQITPERYQVIVESDLIREDWQLPQDDSKSDLLPIKGVGQTPKNIIRQVAYLARHIEQRFHGVPQDIEWTFDGEQIWILQSRPITTLMPIWTRKIAAEVIPGLIRPLTWSINQPLTCGVWGDIFTLVLNERTQGLDFSQTAALHLGHAYFNATLLGEIFNRMGLPAESLEFLTRGAKFQKPPLISTLRNLPGLLKLWQRERRLPSDFAKARKLEFDPEMESWQQRPITQLPQAKIEQRIETILSLLERATYFNILAPLSLALRQAVLKVDLAQLDSRQNPEMRALDDLKQMAVQLRSRLPELGLSSLALDQNEQQDDPQTPNTQTPHNSASLFAAIAEHPEGHIVFDQLDQFLNRYGYLSEVATDIAVPTWRESPQPVRELLTQFLLEPTPAHPGAQQSEQLNQSDSKRTQSKRSAIWRTTQVQARLNLKGQVAEVYDRLMASLRECFVELESRWLSNGRLEAQGDIFFLTWDEIQTQLQVPLKPLALAQSQAKEAAITPSTSELRLKIHMQKARWQQHQNYRVPYLIYGESAPAPLSDSAGESMSTDNFLPLTSSDMLRGIGASAGQAEGTIQVLEKLTDSISIDSKTILVVPYTDAGWSPLLARVGGLIAEVGGQLSHGAIVAREYGIPAVMDVTNATHRLKNGQQVRIDGQHGTIEIL